MPGYPLFLKLEGERCLVFGGGKVATRKIQSLLRCGALVTCVSKDFSKAIRNWAGKKKAALDSSLRLRLLRRASGASRPPAARLPPGQGEAGNDELNGAKLVIVATSDRDFNARVAKICRKKKILVNVVDDPKLCDFYVPAVLERGPLQVAISTGGASPLFARRLREELEKAIPVSTGKMLEKLGKIREKTRA